MKYLSEYRDPAIGRYLLARIRETVTRPRIIMEVCGGQTHTLVREGIDELLAGAVELIHGPGCPVCVTPVQQIDRALTLARRPEVILASFGDMLRVPGGRGNLLEARAQGGDVRVVYSPLDAVELARRHPDREVVFFAVGFETTAPANAMAVLRAQELGVGNFSILASHVTVPPAIRAILEAPGNRVEGVLAAGHVCTVMGWEEYVPLAEEFRVPIVVTGFEPLDLLEGILMAVQQIESGRHEVENQYVRTVRKEGNPRAQSMMEDVFQVVDREWRGIGRIPRSGLALREPFRGMDAECRFALKDVGGLEAPECSAGEVLQGRIRPTACENFGIRCTPQSPMGAPMVSSEGACAAYYRAGRRRPEMGEGPELQTSPGRREGPRAE